MIGLDDKYVHINQSKALKSFSHSRYRLCSYAIAKENKDFHVPSRVRTSNAKICNKSWISLFKIFMGVP